MAIVHEHEPPYSVGYFVGSLAKGSINRTLSKALIRLAPPELEFTEIEIGTLPHYRYDYDADYPQEGALKAAIDAVDAVLFVTPEYNRSIPDDGEVTNDSTAEFLHGFMTSYYQFRTRVLRVVPQR